MKWLNALTVGRRLAVLIVVAAIGLVSIAATGLLQMNHVHDTAGFAQANVVPSLLVLDNAQESFTSMRARTFQSLLATDAAKKNQLLQVAKENHANLDAHLKEYESLIADQKDKELLAEDRSRLAEFDAAREQLMNSSTAGSGAQIGESALQNFTDAARKENDALMDHRAYNVKLADAGAVEAQATMTSARFTLAIMASATLAIVILLGTWMTRSLLRQLGAEPSRGSGDADRRRRFDRSDRRARERSGKRVVRGQDNARWIDRYRPARPDCIGRDRHRSE